MEELQAAKGDMLHGHVMAFMAAQWAQAVSFSACRPEVRPIVLKVYKQREDPTHAGHAACAIAAAARQHKGQLRLLAIGPLTNIALALALDSELVDNLAHCVVMGGYSDSPEFNFARDALAARIVRPGLDLLNDRGLELSLARSFRRAQRTLNKANVRHIQPREYAGSRSRPGSPFSHCDALHDTKQQAICS